MEHAKEVQTEEDHDQTGYDVHSGLVFTQEAAHRSGKCAKDYKDDAEAGNETKCPGQRLAHTALSSAREVRNVDGQHGQKARRNEGDDPFQKSYDILHLLHSFQMCGCLYAIILYPFITYHGI